MPTRRDFCAISRGPQGSPRAALILGGLLLLTVP
jgi:hypothetical protein